PGDIVLAGQRFVEHGEALFDDLASRGLDRLMVGWGRRKALGADQSRKALAVHRANGIFRRFHGAGVGLVVLRQQILAPSEPPRDDRELGQDRAVVAFQGRNLALRADAGKGRLELAAFAQVDELELVRLADFLKQDVNADRAHSGSVVELHLGFLAWLKGWDGAVRLSMSFPKSERR